jgi:hypothetical protein
MALHEHKLALTVYLGGIPLWLNTYSPATIRDNCSRSVFNFVYLAWSAENLAMSSVEVILAFPIEFAAIAAWRAAISSAKTSSMRLGEFASSQYLNTLVSSVSVQRPPSRSRAADSLEATIGWKSPVSKFSNMKTIIECLSVIFDSLGVWARVFRLLHVSHRELDVLAYPPQRAQHRSLLPQL